MSIDSNAYPALYNVIKSRKSTRRYLPDNVDRDLVNAVLDAARLAPSACNLQPWRFYVITREMTELHQAVIKSYDRSWIAEAPVYIVACGDHSQAWHRADGKDHTDIDVAIAVEHICLAAESLGLATCWVCNFLAPELSEALHLPETMEPVAIIPLGYSAKAPDTYRNTPRKSLDEIVQWGI
ncbi:MAG: nitroreductase family protein [Paramuribaculum sp.]|nr:nitroreductase family protein [Paramuribaculum sp.]